MGAATMSSILVSLACVVAIAGFIRVLNWIWLRPKKVERRLRQQGMPGTCYRLLYGDLKDLASLRAQALAKPMTSLSHDYLARMDPLRHQLMTKFGNVNSCRSLISATFCMPMFSVSGCLCAESVCVLQTTGLVKVVNWIWVRPKKLERLLKQQGIPGTSYKLLSGDLKELSSMRSQALSKPMSSFSDDYFPYIEPLRHQLMTKFGKQFFMWVGPTPIVTLSKPELIREVLTKIEIFQKPKMHPLVWKVFTGFINYEGEKWTQHRRMINPAFHTEKLKLMMPAFYESCEEMINKWVELVPEEDSRELDVWPHLVTLSADVISRAAFGSSYAEGQKIFQLLKEQISLTLSMLQLVYIPGRRYIPTARNRRFNEINDQIQSLLEELVDKRKTAMDAGEAAKDDLLGILLDCHLKEIQAANATNNKNRQLRISLQEVIDDCKLFYLAGQETTSVLLVWTLILLSKHQDWQARAREEVLQTFGNQAPNFEGLNHLKTVTMILNEVLRMYTPAPHLNRRVHKDTKLGELSLPAGALVNLQVINTHRDKELWGEDAEEFKPERFSEGISKATRGTNAFFPFSSGPRICIGEKFAITEVKLALSMILQRFSWELSPSYTHSPMIVFFLKPQHGAQIILRRLRYKYII